MNIIAIRTVADFDVILDNSILITGDNTLQAEEIAENMWAILFDHHAIETISVRDLMDFVFFLLKKRKQQVSQIGVTNPVVFYMWFDEMAAQLRFNIISAFNSKLPFGCQLELVYSPESILEDFLASHYHQGIPWDEFEELDDDSDEDEQPFILKVYVAYLN